MAGFRAQLVAGRGEPLIGQAFLMRAEGKGYRVTGVPEGGLLEMHGIYPGAYTLKINVEGRADFVQDIELRPGDLLDMGVIQLQPRTAVAGRLIGDARDISQRTIVLRSVDDDSIQSSTTTNENGWFRLGGLRPGNYLIHLEDDYDTLLKAFEFVGSSDDAERPRRRVTSFLPVDTSGGDVDGVRLYLEEPADVALRAVFNPGDPIDCTLLTPADQVVQRCELFAVDGREHLWVAPGSYDLVWSRGGMHLGRRRIQATTETLWVEILEGE